MTNGDIITDMNLDPLIKSVKDEFIGSIALVPLPSPYGVVKFSENGIITEFKEKPKLSEYWINAGVYCFTPDVFKYLPDKGDIEKTVFPQLAAQRKLVGVPYTNVLWKSIDTHKDISEAEELLKSKLSGTKH